MAGGWEHGGLWVVGGLWRAAAGRVDAGPEFDFLNFSLGVRLSDTPGLRLGGVSEEIRWSSNFAH